MKFKKYSLFSILIMCITFATKYHCHNPTSVDTSQDTTMGQGTTKRMRISSVDRTITELVEGLSEVVVKEGLYKARINLKNNTAGLFIHINRTGLVDPNADQRRCTSMILQRGLIAGTQFYIYPKTGFWHKTTEDMTPAQVLQILERFARGASEDDLFKDMPVTKEHSDVGVTVQLRSHSVFIPTEITPPEIALTTYERVLNTSVANQIVFNL